MVDHKSYTFHRPGWAGAAPRHVMYSFFMFCVSVKVKTPPHWTGQRQAVKAFTSPNTSSLIRNDYDSNEDGLN